MAVTSSSGLSHFAVSSAVEISPAILQCCGNRGNSISIGIAAGIARARRGKCQMLLAASSDCNSNSVRG